MKIISTFVVLVLLCLSSCALVETTGRLSGKVRNEEFKYSTSVVFENGSYWNITLYGTSKYPFVTFDLLKDSTAKTYAITTFGSSLNGLEGISIRGMISSRLGSLFDSGDLVIESITDAQITGIFKNAETIEKTSYLNGNFSVTLP